MEYKCLMVAVMLMGIYRVDTIIIILTEIKVLRLHIKLLKADRMKQV